MSCNGCRVLRKGCSKDCMLRQCLQWIDNPQSQAHATVFVAKFFGRGSLMSFLSSVPLNQRPSLFQSLLFEAVGRTVNPVGGAVGLLWTGNWHQCQAAVATVLRSGVIETLPEYNQCGVRGVESDVVSECGSFIPGNLNSSSSGKSKTELAMKSNNRDDDQLTEKVSCGHIDLRLCLTYCPGEKRKRALSSLSESQTTMLGSAYSRNDELCDVQGSRRIKLLKLFA